jgi:pyrroloquinoline-quinone synthase
MNQRPWTRQEFVLQLKKAGASYHHRHPFHILMNAGQLHRREIQFWVANRFYYQTSIPIKDAAIISNCPFREVRRVWLHRISDHDGTEGNEGGIAAWLILGEACGLSRPAMLTHRYVVPGVRFAVDAYVHFARTRPWPVAVASSLTELFAPDLMAKRLAAFKKHYAWVKPSGLEYFIRRLTQAPRDSGEALKLTVDYCATRELQVAALDALRFKCDLLWAMLDAIQTRCSGPGSLNDLAGLTMAVGVPGRLRDKKFRHE